MIQTEALITHPDGFGVGTATPAQRAICRMLDGLPLGDLATHPDVVALVGGPEALALIERLLKLGITPPEFIILAAIRGLKTILACAASIRMSQSVDVSRLGPGEVPRISLVSLKLDTSAVAHRLLLETIRASKSLKGLLIAETANTLMLRHPSGRPIELACVAGAPAGGGLVARWSAGAIFDEAPRMSAASDAVVNLSDARTAILGRLLPGAQALYIGSPWAPYGPVYDLVQEFWQRPTEHMVVLRGTGPMLNPLWWTSERCAQLQERDPTAHTTDVLGEFADPESGLLNPASLRANTRATPFELPPTRGRAYAAAVDPSEGGAGGNGFTLVIVEHVRLAATPGTEAVAMFRVALAREWRGERPEQCWEQIATICKSYGVTEAWSDQYAASANVDLAQRHGLTVRIDKATAASKLEDFTNLATLIHTDRIELSPDPQLSRDLLSVKKRTTQQGLSIVFPRVGGRHADLAPALCSAVKRAGMAAGRDTGGTYHIHSDRSDSRRGEDSRRDRTILRKSY